MNKKSSILIYVEQINEPFQSLKPLILKMMDPMPGCPWGAEYCNYLLRPGT